MLHRIVKLVTAYIGSVCERKNIDLDERNYTVEITVSTRNVNGDLISVTNSIDVRGSLPHTYSETIRNAAGQTIDFVAGASGNRRKIEQDKLVNAFADAKMALAESELGKAVIAVAEVCAGSTALSLPENPNDIVPTTIKIKKTRVKKEKQDEPQTA